MSKHIAVLVSGGGTNLQALIDAQARGSPAMWWPGRNFPPVRP